MGNLSAMYKATISKTTLIFLLFAVFNNACAQDTTANNLPKRDTVANNFPKAVLVQLRSEHNKVAALIKARRYKDLEKLKTDAVNVQNAMINDFQDHFTDCPVYYYIDTNAPLIQKKIFDGILLNADLTPAKHLPISDTSSDYLVAFYGYPVVQSAYTEVVTDSVTDSAQYIHRAKDPFNIASMSNISGPGEYMPNPRDPLNNANEPNTSGPEVYMHSAGEPFGIGLVILNSNFLQVNYFYKLGYQAMFLRRRSKKDKYHYSSKRYDMEYFPFAEMFNEKLASRRGIRDMLWYNSTKSK